MTSSSELYVIPSMRRGRGTMQGPPPIGGRFGGRGPAGRGRGPFSRTWVPLPPSSAQHPLPAAWKFYIYRRGKTQAGSFATALRNFGDCDTVETFWAHYSCIVRLSQLQTYADLFVFHADVPPLWEDASNQAGGAISITCQRSQIDAAFETTVLNAIGGRLPFDSQIAGVVGSHRAQPPRVAIWLRTCDPVVVDAASAFLSSIVPTASPASFKPHRKAANEAPRGKAIGKGGSGAPSGDSALPPGVTGVSLRGVPGSTPDALFGNTSLSGLSAGLGGELLGGDDDGDDPGLHGLLGGLID